MSKVYGSPAKSGRPKHSEQSEEFSKLLSQPESDGSPAAAGAGNAKKAQPLVGVVALLDIFTSDGSDGSGAIRDKLRALGAKVADRFTKDVTHVIFKGTNPVRGSRASSDCVQMAREKR